MKWPITASVFSTCGMYRVWPEKAACWKKSERFLRRQVDVDLFEVSRAVVAGDAGEVDAKEDLPEQDRELIVRVELMDLAEVVAMSHLARLSFHMLAHDRIGRGNHIVALCRKRRSCCCPVVIRAIRRETLLQDVMEQGVPRDPSCRWLAACP